MKKIGIILTVVFIAFSGVLKAQEVEINKDDFSNKEDYKTAKDLVKTADSEYEVGGYVYYRNALEKYLKVIKWLPNHPLLNYKIGICYMRSIQRNKSLEYFKKASEKNPNVAEDILWQLATGYQLNVEWDKAIEAYKKYQYSLSPSALQEMKKKIDKRIQECTNGKDLSKNQVRVYIDNVGPSINTSYPEYSPLISADESMLLFTGQRPDSYDGKVSSEDNSYFENIFISYKNGNEWQAAKNLGKPVNTSNDNIATAGLTPDGQQMFVFRGGINGGDIFMSKLEGNEWTKPDDTEFGKNINLKSWEKSANLSFDGRTMIYVSDREGSFGEHDLWISQWDVKKERWGEPKNIGGPINTEFDEECVFLHPDGRTLYFSSTGHNTIGGFDIFKTTLNDDGTWTEPENIGYPINTPDDDRFFVLSASGRHGYYSSARDDSYGDADIYMITFRGPEKTPVLQNEDNLLANVEPVAESIIAEQVEIKTTRLTILKGTIKDALTLNPVEAQIEIVDNVKNEVISIASSNSSTGKYLISLPSGRNYGIAVKSTGYLFHSENFDIPAATNYQEITKDILLNKMAVGQKVILKNIFFDYAKATLRSESFPELDRLVKMLTDFPNIRIEISGHTDNQGSLQTNQKLSENRAKAVVEYLISKGIAQSRLEFKGYAYLQPIASNDKEDGRQQNRRVEFKVLQN